MADRYVLLQKKEVEIDIVVTLAEGNEYIIGSCRYKNEPVGVDELELIKEYAESFGKGEKYHYILKMNMSISTFKHVVFDMFEQKVKKAAIIFWEFLKICHTLSFWIVVYIES